MTYANVYTVEQFEFIQFAVPSGCMDNFAIWCKWQLILIGQSGYDFTMDAFGKINLYKYGQY
jgi:hypothetical protein